MDKIKDGKITERYIEKCYHQYIEKEISKEKRNNFAFRKRE